MTPTMADEDFFSQTYGQARQRFLDAATRGGLAMQAMLHPQRGREGEALALDVARFGPDDARAVLIISSGCHGVEGFCGSGVQSALLADPDFHAAASEAGVAVLYLHALNPHGFSWWRRTTHENIDLNRNWQDFSQPLPVNHGYEELADALVPATWPPTPENEAVLADYAQRHGAMGLQAAISGGQYTHPKGLFYGGQSTSWCLQALGTAMAAHARKCQRLGWIDLHTGLGPSGVGERIFAAAFSDETLARARQWWGPGVTCVEEGSSSSAPLTGMIWAAAAEVCPQAEHTGIALEYGTLPLPQMINALRADQWRENHPEASTEQAAAIRRQSRDAFYVDTPQWKAQIISQGREAARQAVRGLALDQGVPRNR
jgi:hypothetical protein